MATITFDVSSTAVSMIQYETETETLTVAFRARGKGVYSYRIPIEEWNALKKAGSTGHELNRIIRQYPMI